MEVREELKELIEKARARAVEAGDLPEGEYAPVRHWKFRNQRNSATIPQMQRCSGQERPAKHRA